MAESRPAGTLSEPNHITYEQGRACRVCTLVMGMYAFGKAVDSFGRDNVFVFEFGYCMAGAPTSDYKANMETTALLLPY